MILAKSKTFKAFICALVCALIVLSPTFSAPQRVEASAGAIAIVATVGVLAIGLSYLYGTGLASRIVEKCKQSDFAQYVANIGNKAIQYGTGVGLYSVAQRTVNDLIKKGVSSSTISSTSDPAQAMSLLTTNNVTVKPTSSELTTIVNSIPANTVIDNPSYAPRSSLFIPIDINNSDFSSYSDYSTYFLPDYNNFRDLILRISDYYPSTVNNNISNVPLVFCATSSYSGASLISNVVSSSHYLWLPLTDLHKFNGNDSSYAYLAGSAINGFVSCEGSYYPCYVDKLTGNVSVFSKNNTNFGNNISCVAFSYAPILHGSHMADNKGICLSPFNNSVSNFQYRTNYIITYYYNYYSTNNNPFNPSFLSQYGYYLVTVPDASLLADHIHVNGSQISEVKATGSADAFLNTPTLNINKVTTGVAQPDVDIKLNANDKGDNVYLPIVPSIAVDGFSVPTDTVVDNIPVTVPSEVIDNIDVSVDDYVTDNPTDVNVVVDTSSIVTSIDYVTQAIEDSNYHKGFTVPNFNIDVPQYDSNFLSRWGKWIEFTRGVFNGLSGTELGGIVITSALIMVAVAVFRKVL